jgi:flagellar biosynthesis protein FlhF
MQVKKFEAKSMKEALELVKLHLGPEAIILSAKDHSRGFGLAGQKSVEVTAAISEETLRRKQLAESKLTATLKSRYILETARRQRDFIDKANLVAPVPPPRPAPKMRYADIQDEELNGGYNSPASVRHVSAPAPSPIGREVIDAQTRVKSAAERAWRAMAEAEGAPPRPATVQEAGVIRDLKAEIHELKKTLAGFQKMPQTFVNMHPGAEFGIIYELSSLYQKLIRAGLSVDNSVELLKQAQTTLTPEQIKKVAFVEAWIARSVMEQTRIADNRTTARLHAFMGPAGQGKTSALVKTAGHMVICEKKKIAIVTTDLAKVGASEQLRIYAQILNVPFACLRSREEWPDLLRQLSQVDHILIDYPGYNLKSMQEIDSLRGLLPSKELQPVLHYVQSVLANDETAFETGARYQVIGFDDVIFTGLDEAAQHGLIFNFQKKFQVPLHSFGIGRQIPEDFEPATRERVVDLIFKLSNFRKDKNQ